MPIALVRPAAQCVSLQIAGLQYQTTFAVCSPPSPLPPLPQEIETAVKECRGAGGENCRVEFHGADLTRPTEIASMFEFVKDRFGGTPDILVNNAGACGTHRVYSIR